MASLLRILLVATALLTSGVLQLAEAMGADACCAGATEETDDSRPDCPTGFACACCPTGGAVEAAAPQVAPAAEPRAAVDVAAPRPSARASASDIFHPPRA